jgi:3-dehydroquinate synthase
MNISSKLNDYSVRFCDFNLNFLSGDSNIIVFVDMNVFRLYEDYFMGTNNLIIIEAQEFNKSIEYALVLIEKLLIINVNKSFKLYAIGGGIVQDLVGFIASVYYRGIRYILVPTTLLAMADSCIGSKTSINFNNFKNIIGTFYPPERVLIDSNFIFSLSRSDYISGLGEILKLAIIGGHKHLEEFELNLPLILSDEIDLKIVNYHILSSLTIKKEYIEQDEFDNGVRNKLNFGHLHAHAIETSLDYKVPHGIAVLFGLLASIKISFDKAYISEPLLNRIFKIIGTIIKEHSVEYLFDKKKVLNAMKKDKKQTSRRIYDYCLNENLELKKTRISLSEIEESIKFLNNVIKVS